MPSQVLPRSEGGCAALVGEGLSAIGPDGERHTAAEGRLVLPAGGPYEITGGGRAVADVFVGDLWVLAGQSNMAGAGQLDPPPAPEPRARMLSFDGRWTEALDPLHRLWADGDTVIARAARRFFYPAYSDDEWATLLDLGQRGEVEAPRVGPGAAFAQAYSEHTGVPVGLLPCALGSTSLGMWMPDAEPGLPREETLYGNLVARARRFGPVKGVLWHQGEGDSGPGLGATYPERFTRFVAQLRNDLDDPALPVVAAQIGRYDLALLKSYHGLDVDPAAVADWPVVRDAMRRVGDAAADVYVVATADLGLVDGVHLDRAGQEALGRRMAAAATGRPVPQLASVTRLDRTTVACRFTGIVEGITIDGPSDFEPPGAVRVAAPDTVVVELGQPADTLTYGPGINPRAGLHDGGFALPLFGPVPIG